MKSCCFYLKHVCWLLEQCEPSVRVFSQALPLSSGQKVVGGKLRFGTTCSGPEEFSQCVPPRSSSAFEPESSELERQGDMMALEVERVVVHEWDTEHP